MKMDKERDKKDLPNVLKNFQEGEGDSLQYNPSGEWEEFDAGQCVICQRVSHRNYDGVCIDCYNTHTLKKDDGGVKYGQRN